MKTNKKLLIASALLIAGVSSTNAMYIPEGADVDPDLNPNIRMLNIDSNNSDNILYEDSLIETIYHTMSIESYLEWVITKIENGKDWKMIYIEDNNGVTYSSAVSVLDKTVSKKLAEFQIWDEVKLFYSEILDDSNIVIWDKIEYVWTALSKNDQKKYDVLKSRVALKDQKAITNFVSTYETKLKKLDIEKQEKLNKTMISKVDVKLNTILEKLPQDSKMDKKTTSMYYFLTLLELELKKL